MLRLILFLSFFYTGFHNVFAISNTDSNTYRYFIYKNKNSLSAGHIVKEGKTIIAKDKAGNRFRGKIYIIDDSTFYLLNLWTEKRDTFKVSNIHLIRKPTLISAIGGVYLVFGSIGSVVLGLFIADFLDDDVQIPVLTFFGVSALVNLVSGVAIFNGPTFKNSKYQFFTFTTKGFKLKRKHLPLLFPEKT